MEPAGLVAAAMAAAYVEYLVLAWKMAVWIVPDPNGSYGLRPDYVGLLQL